jgi:hypothetical protein
MFSEQMMEPKKNPNQTKKLMKKSEIKKKLLKMINSLLRRRKKLMNYVNRLRKF